MIELPEPPYAYGLVGFTYKQLVAYGQACANAALEEAADACRNEYLLEPQNLEDFSYDGAVTDCIAAIHLLKVKT